MPDSFSQVKAVFEQQSMYDAVVHADYMQHSELAASIAAWARTQSAPLRIIDLGCGDAWLATHAFRNATVDSYRGVDVSDSSIERARKNTAIWPGRAELAVGNLADFIHNEPDASANVVLASYSVHHLSSEGKIALIADCQRVIVPGGALLWIDPVRHDDESRDDYVDRLAHVIYQDWTALTLDDRKKACTHVRTSDFPETASWMRDHMQQTGFKRTATLLHDDFFDGWVFTKS
jgi:ubiquinone/menaquinone biosynthesis C-methylase UbiE